MCGYVCVCVFLYVSVLCLCVCGCLCVCDRFHDRGSLLHWNRIALGITYHQHWYCLNKVEALLSNILNDTYAEFQIRWSSNDILNEIVLNSLKKLYSVDTFIIISMVRCIGVLHHFSTIFGYIWQSVSTARGTNCSWEWTSSLPLATDNFLSWDSNPSGEGRVVSRRDALSQKDSSDDYQWYIFVTKNLK